MIARLQPLAGSCQRQPIGAGLLSHQIDVHRHVRAERIPGRTHTFQGRRNDARIVENEMIASIEIARQIPDRRILQPSIAVHDQQTRRILRRHRPQRDMAFWQIEIEGRQIGQGPPLFHHSWYGWNVAKLHPPRIRIGEDGLPLFGIRPLNKSLWTFGFRQVGDHFG